MKALLVSSVFLKRPNSDIELLIGVTVITASWRTLAPPPPVRQHVVTRAVREARVSVFIHRKHNKTNFTKTNRYDTKIYRVWISFDAQYITESSFYSLFKIDAA